MPHRNEKNVLVQAITIALAAASIDAHAFTISWRDNTAPASAFPTQTSAAGLANGFSTHNEFRIMIPDGSGSTAGGGEKNLVGDGKSSGAGTVTTLPHDFVTWVFDDVTGELAGVTATDTTGGAHYYAAGCGYIAGTCTNDSVSPDGGEGLFRSAAFLGSPFGFLAPTTTHAAGVQYGPGQLTLTGSDEFSIHFPVMEAQWSEGYFTLGSAAGGITFNCTGALTGIASCFGEHLIAPGEDPLGFTGLVAQWELHGLITDGPGQQPFVQASINLQNNAQIECSETGGSSIQLDAQIEVFNGGEAGVVEWFLDDALAAMGETATMFVPLGSHTVDLSIAIVNGQSEMVADAASITVSDTTRPNLTASFRDSRSGDIVTTVPDRSTNFVRISLEPTDICDPAPRIVESHIIPAYDTADGEIVTIRANSGIVKMPITAISLQATAKDAAYNSSFRASAILKIEP